MFDFWDYQIAANTTQANKVTRECKISPGVLTDIRVYFPLGVNGLAKCRVSIGESPVLPRSKGSYVTGDGADVIAQNIFEPITGNIPVLKWELWNEDTSYPHTLMLKAAWVTEEEMAADRALLAAMLNRLDAIARALGGA